MNGQCAFEAGGCPAAGAPPEHAACSPDLAVLLNDPVLSFGFNVPDTAAARAGRADNALPPAHPAADQENFNLLELHGDEQTWDLEDWNWDANALEASRKLAGAAPVYPDPSMQCQSAGAAPCSFAMPTGMQHCHNAVSHLGKLQACSGADDSPFMQASAADLGLAAAHKGGCSEGDACCDEPDAKRARHAAGCGCDNQAELDAAIANGAVVIHSKPPATDTENMVCQVPGCGKDLGCMKEYHQRYRVCETHIRLPAIVKDGRLQRFCQQCGRFHLLSEFDGAKRSCRSRLQRHNARRRKRAMDEAEELGLAGANDSRVAEIVQAAVRDAAEAAQMQAPKHVSIERASFGDGGARQGSTGGDDCGATEQAATGTDTAGDGAVGAAIGGGSGVVDQALPQSASPAGTASTSSGGEPPTNEQPHVMSGSEQGTTLIKLHDKTLPAVGTVGGGSMSDADNPHIQAIEEQDVPAGSQPGGNLPCDTSKPADSAEQAPDD